MRERMTLPREIPEALRDPEPVQIPRLALKPLEAANSIGISEKHLLRSDAPRIRIGTSVRFPIREFANWLSARVETPELDDDDDGVLAVPTTDIDPDAVSNR